MPVQANFSFLFMEHRFNPRHVYNINAAARSLLDGHSEAIIQPLNRVKLLVVGRERVGKTSTVRALLGKPFNKEEPSTVGAAIVEGHSARAPQVDSFILFSPK